MHNISEEYIPYSRYRFEKACTDLRASKKLFEITDYAGANNRS